MRSRRSQPFLTLVVFLALIQCIGSLQSALATGINGIPLNTIVYQAIGGTPRASTGLRTPIAPTSSKVYTWDIKPAFSFVRIDLAGCWNRQQISSVAIDPTNAYVASINGDGSIRLTPRIISNTVQKSVPVAIQATFTKAFSSAEGVTKLTSTNYRGGRQ